MTTPRKLARQRARRKRQQETMKNLQRGAEEQKRAGNRQGNPDDPMGRVMGGAAAVRVISDPGVEPTKYRPGPGPTSGAARRGGKTVQITAQGRRANSGANVRVVSGQPSQSAVRVTSGGGSMMQGGARVVSGSPQRVQQPPQGSMPAHGMAAGQQVEMQRPRGMAPRPTPKPSSAPKADVTAILTCFERPDLFRKQLDALRSQTLQPANIIVWVNTGTVPHDERALRGAADVVVIRANTNMGPWIRFTMALEAPTKYVAILDDDTIPGPGWIEACVKRLEEDEQDSEDGEPGLCIAAAGEVFAEDDPQSRYVVGPESPRIDEMEVDIGRQGWFFRKDFIHLFMTYPRVVAPIGWGLHFSAALQDAGILTIVLPYEPGNTHAWGMTQMPVRQNSISERIQSQVNRGGKDIEYLRAEIYDAYRQGGWSPLVVLDTQDDPGGDEGQGKDQESAG